MTKPLEILFRKYSGIGNTFLIFQDEEAIKQLEKAEGILFSELVRLCCDSTFGFQADGGFLLTQKQPLSLVPNDVWTWSFYNSDGSKAEMCGNAARCAAHAIFSEIKNGPQKIQLVTSAGQIQCEKKALGFYAVEMIMPVWMNPSMIVEGKQMAWLDTGVPHAVFEGLPLNRELSKELRFHKDFGQRGANITSYSVLERNHLRAISYERGVENFTLACGTGAVAAALTYWIREYDQKTEEKIQVDMPGGQLEIEVGPGKKPIMVGPAVLVGEMKISWENLTKFFQKRSP